MAPPGVENLFALQTGVSVTTGSRLENLGNLAKVAAAAARPAADILPHRCPESPCRLQLMSTEETSRVPTAKSLENPCITAFRS